MRPCLHKRLLGPFAVKSLYGFVLFFAGTGQCTQYSRYTLIYSTIRLYRRQCRRQVAAGRPGQGHAGGAWHREAVSIDVDQPQARDLLECILFLKEKHKHLIHVLPARHRYHHNAVDCCN